MPVVEKVNLPGFALRSAISSFTLLTGTVVGFTTRNIGIVMPSDTGAKSFTGSYWMFFCV